MLNYYEGWTEAELLAERMLIQRQLSAGRIVEIRLAGETTRMSDRESVTTLETTLERIAYALYVLCTKGETAEVYTNPYERGGVTIQNFQ